MIRACRYFSYTQEILTADTGAGRKVTWKTPKGCTQVYH